MSAFFALMMMENKEMECKQCTLYKKIAYEMLDRCSKYENNSPKKINEKSWFKRNKFNIIEQLIIIIFVTIVFCLNFWILNAVFMGFGIVGIASFIVNWLKCFYD